MSIVPAKTRQRWALMIMTVLFLSAALQVRALESPETPAKRTHFQFSFGTVQPKDSFLQALPTTIYTQEVGYGLEERVNLDLSPNEDFCITKPFLFNVDVPEDNCRIKRNSAPITGPDQPMASDSR